MSSSIMQQDSDDTGFSIDEPSAKRKKTNGRSFNPSQSPDKEDQENSINEEAEPLVRKNPETITFLTEPTHDENIFPDATYQSFEEFEKKFNIWKTKYQHPFRVASSEALRTEGGLVSGKFKYRYVVYHCARYGVPRVRGEGKRPNQHYLPCNCTAMIRLNFNFNEQCLKLTSLETRHSNHTLDKNLYDRMIVKEEKRKQVPPRRRTIGATTTRAPVTIKSEPTSDERADSENTSSYSSSPVNFCIPPSNQLPSSMKSEFNGGYAHQVPPYLPHSHIPPHLPPNAMTQALEDVQRLHSQMAINQMNVFVTSPYTASSSTWSPTPMVLSSQATSLSSAQISPVSSTVDENEAPKQFLSTATVRPIPLHPSENTAFHQMIHESTRVSPIPKAEIDSILASASRMLLDVNLPSDVLQNRMKQLNHLISQWSH